MERSRRALSARRAGVVVTLAAAALTGVAAEVPAGALGVAPTGSLVLTLRGNGHGHGMSQFGAQAAAAAGQKYPQILAFYYPGSTLTTLSVNRIRVGLSGTGRATTVGASPDLVVSGVAGTLPSTGINKYRLVADSAPGSTGLVLQRRGPATKYVWTTVATGLANRAQFHRTSWAPVRVYFTDGSNGDYYGRIRGVRVNGSSAVSTVDVLGLDHYVAGVVPREMPDSWQPQALAAQAVAARTYAAYEMAHPVSGEYDICDSTWCQVYGGHAQHNTDGSVVLDDPVPAAATSGKVLEYKGAPIFAQFSASNGGYTVAGGQPYLPAKKDNYDPDVQANDNWYINYTHTISAAKLGAQFGLKDLTTIMITQRDGKGAWGGRVLAGYVSGTDGTGNAATVNFTGAQLQSALGIGTTLLTISVASP